MIDSPYRVKPGQKHNLAKVSTDDTGKFEAKEDAAHSTEKNLKRLAKLQELLYAEGKHAITGERSIASGISTCAPMAVIPTSN